MKGTLLIVSIIVWGTFSAFFFMYLLFAFVCWVVGDPFGIISVNKLPEPSNYEKCADRAESTFDQFNDTVWATYATADTPSDSITDFIDHCLENTKLLRKD